MVPYYGYLNQAMTEIKELRVDLKQDGPLTLNNKASRRKDKKP